MNPFVPENEVTCEGDLADWQAFALAYYEPILRPAFDAGFRRRASRPGPFVPAQGRRAGLLDDVSSVSAASGRGWAAGFGSERTYIAPFKTTCSIFTVKPAPARGLACWIPTRS